MTSIKVLYTIGDHTPYEVKVSGLDCYVRFVVEGSSASVKKADCGGEFLQEAFAHVRELDFIQAVEEL
jgi:hypothetical protein